MTDPESSALKSRYRKARDAHGLAKRVTELEQDLADARQLHQRVAELTDIVSALLVELARMDPERASTIIDGYIDQLGT